MSSVSKDAAQNKRLRVAVVGVGHLGRYHAQKMKGLSALCELVALVDPDAARKEALDKEFAVPVLESIDALPQIDAAVIATPTSTHADVAEALIRRGVHVMIEKPAVRTTEEGARVLKAMAEHPKVVVQVGHIERFNPAIVAVESVLDRPWYIVSERLGPFKERSLDVDVIDDLMIHDLELCLHWLRGAKPTDVRGVGVQVMTPFIDMANVRIEFDTGAVASLTASRSSLESTRKIRLFTEHRYLSLDLGARQAKSVKRIPPAQPTDWPEIEAEMLDVQSFDALEAENRSFLLACLGQEPVRVTFASALAAVELAQRVKTLMKTPPGAMWPPASAE